MTKSLFAISAIIAVGVIIAIWAAPKCVATGAKEYRNGQMADVCH